MTDHEVLISTLREARRIIGEYIGPGPRKADQTLTQLIAAGRTWHTPLNGLRRVMGFATL